MKSFYFSINSCLIILFLFIGSSIGYSQKINHEIGIRFSSFESFGFIYKHDKKPNVMNRYWLTWGRLGYRSTSNNGLFDFSAGFAIGREKRKKITEKLSFIHGFEPRLGVDLSINSDNTLVRLRPGLGYVLGFHVDMSDEFYISIETIPLLSTSLIIDEDGLQDNFLISAGFNTNSISITLGYKFEAERKKKKKSKE